MQCKECGWEDYTAKVASLCSDTFWQTFKFLRHERGNIYIYIYTYIYILHISTLFVRSNPGGQSVGAHEETLARTRSCEAWASVANFTCTTACSHICKMRAVLGQRDPLRFCGHQSIWPPGHKCAIHICGPDIRLVATVWQVTEVRQKIIFRAESIARFCRR